MADIIYDKIIEDNMSLVYKLISVTVHGVISQAEYDDLIQIGRIALFKAAKAYDKKSKAKFSTFAWIVIRNDLLDYLRTRERVLERQTQLTQKMDQFSDEDEQDTLSNTELRLDLTHLLQRSRERAQKEGKTDLVRSIQHFEAQLIGDPTKISSDYSYNQWWHLLKKTKAYLKNQPEAEKYDE